jgi:hypothetical protein
MVVPMLKYRTENWKKNLLGKRKNLCLDEGRKINGRIYPPTV